MSITQVSFDGFSPGGSNPVAVSPTAYSGGELVVLCVIPEIATGDIHVTTITDNIGNTYVAVPGAQLINTAEGVSTDIWYAANVNSGSPTISITCNTTSIIAEIVVARYTGVALISPATDGQNMGATGSATLGPVLTASNGQDLLITTTYKHSANTTGVTSPWIKPSGAANNNFVYLIAPGSPGTYQAIYTPSQTDLYVSSGAVFSPPLPPAVSASMFLVF